MNVCVFCSACEQLDNAYITAARQLGRWAAQNGHTIVYGGVRQGLMEQLAQACKEAGGTTVGVVPRVVVQQGRVSDHADVLIHCEDLSDRKALMMSAAMSSWPCPEASARSTSCFPWRPCTPSAITTSRCCCST